MCVNSVFHVLSMSSGLMVQIDGDVVFFDGTLFENFDEGVLCRFFQVTCVRFLCPMFSFKQIERW